MKNIIKHLFYGNISESERNISHLFKTTEYKQYKKAYCTLKATFSKKQIKLFNIFCEKEDLFSSLYHETIYSNGVKTGMCLGLELIDFNPSE